MTARGHIRLLVSLVAALGWLPGCGSIEASSAEGPPLNGFGGSVSTGGSAGRAPSPTQIELRPKGTLRLRPAEKATVAVQTLPAVSYSLALTLLEGSGDASLDSNSLSTSDSGQGSFTLTAPTKSTAFRVQVAGSSGVAATLDVSVSGSGYGSLTLDATYPGQRKSTTYTASIHSQETCAQLSASAPADGALAVHSTSLSELTITDVPAETPFSVGVRGDHNLFGCVDVDPLSAEEQRRLKLELSDIPLNLSATSLPFSLALDLQSTAINDTLDAALPTFVNNFLGSSGQDAAALLEAMTGKAAVGTEKPEVELRQLNNDWSGRISQYFKQLGSARPLSAALESAYTQARDNLKPANLAKGTLVFGAVETDSQLMLQSFLGLKTSSCSIAETSPLSFKVEPGDRLLWSSTISWTQGPVLGCLVAQGLALPTGGYNTVADYLAQSVVKCPSLAKALGDAPSDLCDAACVTRLCSSAVQTMWANAQAKTGTLYGTSLELSSAGALRVNDQAKALSSAGTWVGKVTSPADSKSANGTFAQ